jgi:hypothetical protein
MRDLLAGMADQEQAQEPEVLAPLPPKQSFKTPCTSSVIELSIQLLLAAAHA